MPRRRLALLLLVAAPSCAAPASPAPARVELIRYTVAAGPGARVLDVDVELPPGPARALRVDDGVDRFVRDVTFSEGGASRPIEAEGSRFRAPPCHARCHVHYRFLLGDAAAYVDDASIASAEHGALLAPASTWLLRPAGSDVDRDSTRFRLRVTTPPDIRFATGLYRSADEPGAFEASLSDLPAVTYAAFGALTISEIPWAGGALELAVLPGPLGVEGATLRRWAEDGARSIAGYYGTLPFPRALVIVLPTSGAGVGFSTALGNGGAAAIVRIGRHTSGEELLASWELTHELMHLSFPNLSTRYTWLEEGLATYVEPIARARAGLRSVDGVWSHFAWGMPKGLPAPGDRGLDHGPRWGRLYWGGALFCFVADVEIRRRTGGARSFEDALRAIAAAGGNVSVRWPMERVIDVGDRATGVPVLRELYDAWKDEPANVDLDGLWRELGLRFEDDGDRVLYDDRAPLAAIRDAILPRAKAPARRAK